jgi:hypothetical protein
MDLPLHIQFALSSLLGAMPAAELARATGQLSGRYRSAEDRSGQPLVRSRADVLAYAAFRLPATFAAVAAAMERICVSRPDWRPRTLLDAGSGPGTAAWAALATWPDLDPPLLLEPNRLMIALGQEIARAAGIDALPSTAWCAGDVLSHRDESCFDLVTAAYVLGEQPPAEQEAFVQRLWSWTADALLLVEPGTPEGFGRIRRARGQLIDAGGALAGSSSTPAARRLRRVRMGACVRCPASIGVTLVSASAVPACIAAPSGPTSPMKMRSSPTSRSHAPATARAGRVCSAIPSLSRGASRSSSARATAWSELR